MKDIVEIRWHGRGTKTASLLPADAAFNMGKYVQGFLYPYTAWKDSFIHNAFENAGVTISGVETANTLLLVSLCNEDGGLPSRSGCRLSFPLHVEGNIYADTWS